MLTIIQLANKEVDSVAYVMIASALGQKSLELLNMYEIEEIIW